jgi:hypothetical protein
MRDFRFPDRKLLILSIAILIALQGCNLPVNRGEVTPVQTQDPTETSTPILLPEAVIGGRVWHDLCSNPSDGSVPDPFPDGCIPAPEGSLMANGVIDQGEPGIDGLIVSLGTGVCPSTGLATTETEAGGMFEFSGLGAGSYCLMIDLGHPTNSQVLKPGSWTTGQAEGERPLVITYDLEPGQSITTLAFGWDYQNLPVYLPPATSTPTPTPVDTATTTPTAPPGSDSPAATATATGDDPSLPLGGPDWRDIFTSSANWFSGASSYEDDHVRFKIENGAMKMTAFEANFREGWVLSWPKPENFYLEATFKVLDCSGADRYGLFARATNVDENPHGYLIGLTCDGKYSLRIFDEEFSNVIGWTASNNIHQGSNQTHRLGFWADGTKLRIYVDGKKLVETNDSTFDSGPFGVFIGAAETENFTVEVEEIAYWTLE